MSYKIVDMRTPRSMYWCKATYAMNPIGVVIHNTANSASARNEIRYMNSNTNYVSYHVAIDDKEAVQAIPFNRNTWACGDGVNGRGNRRMISIEVCYSKDGGINGYKSDRYRKAEDNTALYVAHILKQYGWTTKNIYTHQQMNGKYCPHVILASGTWNQFIKKVQDNLDRLNGVKTQPSKVSKKESESNSQWKTNRYGTQYKALNGKFRVGNQPIMTRFASPFTSATRGGFASPGTVITFHEIVRQDNHIWLGYYNHVRKLKYIPVRTWNSRTGAVGALWGSWG